MGNKNLDTHRYRDTRIATIPRVIPDVRRHVVPGWRRQLPSSFWPGNAGLHHFRRLRYSWCPWLYLHVLLTFSLPLWGLISVFHNKNLNIIYTLTHTHTLVYIIPQLVLLLQYLTFVLCSCWGHRKHTRGIKYSTISSLRYIGMTEQSLTVNEDKMTEIKARS